MSSVTSLGVLLQQHRAAAALSQEELAERAGLSRRAISDLERGMRVRPYPSTLRRLSEALGLSEEAHLILTRAAATRRLVSSPDGELIATDEPPSAAEHALPPDLTSFIGREHERAHVQRLLTNTRLLTLVGSGGVGKTRLAVSVAREWLTNASTATVHNFIGLVDLAPLVEPDLLPQTVAAQLGIKEHPGRPVLETIVDALQSRSGLLVLDNCEHLVESCATFVHELLTGCAALRVLVTSREALALPAETVWRVPSLDVPQAGLDLDHFARFPSVQLFVERARAVLPTFELDARTAPWVNEICRRLDGIPLALELAAARVSVLEVQQIAARLDDALELLVGGRRLVPARQQTVRATLDWSYTLLTGPEQAVFERLSVFVGNWALEAAESVATTDELPSRAMLPLLGRLADGGMVVVDRNRGGARYRLLEIVRQYARERLMMRVPSQALRSRHAGYYLSICETIEPDLFGPKIKAAQDRIQADYDNIRAALGWLVDQTDVDGAQRLAGAMGAFWFFQGHLSEAGAWLEQVLALPDATRPTLGRAKCLFGSSLLAISRGDFDLVATLAEEARSLFHALGDAFREGYALSHLGLAQRRSGKYSEARRNLEAALALSRVAGHKGLESNCLFTLAWLTTDLGDHAQARVFAEAALGRAAEINHVIQTADAERLLGVVSLRQGDYSAASRWLQSSLATWREMGLPWFLAHTLVRVAQLAIDQANVASARTHLTEALVLAEKLDDRHALAEVLEGFAQVASLENEPTHALRLAGAAEALRASIRIPVTPAERLVLERNIDPGQRTLDLSLAEAALNQGRALLPSQMIQLALDAPARAEVPAFKGLTARESTVARLVARGLTNRQIGHSLAIAPGTAQRHLENIRTKLKVHSRAEVAAWAAREPLRD